TECPAKLILLQNRPGLTASLQEKVVGIEGIVAEKLPHTPVKGVGSRLTYNVNVGSSTSTVASVIHSSLYLELCDCVRRRDRNADFRVKPGSRVFRNVVRVDAIELEVVGSGFCSVGGNILRVAA